MNERLNDRPESCLITSFLKQQCNKTPKPLSNLQAHTVAHPRPYLPHTHATMEAVLRHTALIKSQAKRKSRILEQKKLVRDRVQYRLQNSIICKENTASIRAARKSRREDWEMGALAPWRAAAAYATVAGTGTAGSGVEDAGTAREDHHGTWSARQMNLPKVPKQYRVKEWFIRVGDRCVVVEGREGVKGRIGVVKEVNHESETVVLEGINMVSLPLSLHLSRRPGTAICLRASC